MGKPKKGRRKTGKLRTITEKQRFRPGPLGQSERVPARPDALDCADRLGVEICKLRFLAESLAPDGAGFVLDDVIGRLRGIEGSLIDLVRIAA